MAMKNIIATLMTINFVVLIHSKEPEVMPLLLHHCVNVSTWKSTKNIPDLSGNSSEIQISDAVSGTPKDYKDHTLRTNRTILNKTINWQLFTESKPSLYRAPDPRWQLKGSICSKGTSIFQEESFIRGKKEPHKKHSKVNKTQTSIIPPRGPFLPRSNKEKTPKTPSAGSWRI